MNLLVRCGCGHQIVVSEFAEGMTLPCPNCGQPLTVTHANSQPLEEQAPDPMPIVRFDSGDDDDLEYTPLQTDAVKTRCARCGKEFRGDWDRHPSSMGVLCNICSNLVAQQRTEQQATGYVPPVDMLKIDAPMDVTPPQPPGVEEVVQDFWERYKPDREMKQRIAIGAAVAFGLYTMYLLISGAWMLEPAPDGAEPTAAETVASDPASLPVWARAVFHVLRLSGSFVSMFFAIYIFLTLSRRLPEETFAANVLRLAVPVLVIGTVWWGALMLPFGFVLSLILVPLAIWYFFGLESHDLINLPLGCVLGGVLQFLIYALLSGIVVSIAL